MVIAKIKSFDLPVIDLILENELLREYNDHWERHTNAVVRRHEEARPFDLEDFLSEVYLSAYNEAFEQNVNNIVVQGHCSDYGYSDPHQFREDALSGHYTHQDFDPTEIQQEDSYRAVLTYLQAYGMYFPNSVDAKLNKSPITGVW